MTHDEKVFTHPIIKTENYLLVVDESEIKDDVWHLDNGVIKKWKGNLHSNRLTSKKIICHLPLNNASTLEGVELLPPLEDEAEKFAESKYPKNTDSFYDKGWDESICPKRILSLLKDLTNSTSSALMIACKIGYNKAKEKYKFTKEDLYMLAAKVVNDIAKNKGNTDWNMFTTPKMIAEEFIQQQQPKYPVAFECEKEWENSKGEKGSSFTSVALYEESVGQHDAWLKPKIITNSQGLTQVVGKYIY